MFIKFEAPIDKFVVCRSPSLRPFKKKKNNQNQIDYARLHSPGFYFPLLFGRKNCERNQ